MGLKFSLTKLSWIADFHYIAVFIFADAGSFIIPYIYSLYIRTNRTIRLSRMVLIVNIYVKDERTSMESKSLG